MYNKCILEEKEHTDVIKRRCNTGQTMLVLLPSLFLCRKRGDKVAAIGKKYSNYSGWLIKVGDYVIPTDRYVAAETYEAYANKQDLNPWTDENGELHRNALELKVLSVSFDTPAMLTDDDLAELIKNIDNNIVNTNEDGCYVTAFIPRLNEYVTQYGYMADIKPSIYSNADGVIKYNSIHFDFVGGVYDG